MDETINDISVDEMGNVDLSGIDFSAYENMDFTTTGMDTSMMLDPTMASTLGTIGIIINILGIIFFISGAYGLYLINTKLGEKHAWLSFVPLLQFYNYFTASKKSWIDYLLFPFIALIIGAILSIFTFGLTLIAAYIYFLVMWIKLLHAISLRTGNGAWTTVGFIFVSFIMFPIVGTKMQDQSGEQKIEEKEIIENKNEEKSSIEL